MEKATYKGFCKTSKALFWCKNLAEVYSLMESVPGWDEKKQRVKDNVEKMRECLSRADLLFNAQILCFDILIKL